MARVKAVGLAFVAILAMSAMAAQAASAAKFTATAFPVEVTAEQVSGAVTGLTVQSRNCRR